MIKEIVIFISCLIFSAALAWVGGYNFDERNIKVAGGVLISVILAVSITGFIICIIDLRKEY